MVKTTGKKEITVGVKLIPITAPSVEQGLMYFDSAENRLKISNDGTDFTAVSGKLDDFLAFGSATEGDVTIAAPTSFSYYREFDDLTITNVLTLANGSIIKINGTLSFSGSGSIITNTGVAGGTGGTGTTGTGKGGAGGMSGGGIIIFARKITGTGLIIASGTNGVNGTDGTSSGASQAGGGGGVGADVQLRTISILGTQGLGGGGGGAAGPPGAGAASVPAATVDRYGIISTLLAGYNVSYLLSTGASGGGGGCSNVNNSGQMGGGGGSGGAFGGASGAGGTGGTGTASAGGGGGGGGGAGGSGGFIMLVFEELVGGANVTLLTNGGAGGNGGNAFSANGGRGGGGGGGSGGLIVQIGPSALPTSVTGGALGLAGSGTGVGGVNGSTGSAGVALFFIK